MKKPQSLRSILEKTIQSLEIDIPLKTYSILGAWKDIVGDSLAGQTQPRSIRNRILFVDVSHSTWIQQLQFLKPTLLEKVNAFLGEPLIQDIRFKQGKISTPPPALPKIPSLKDEKPDKATLNRIESIIQKIDDQDLRKIMRDVLMRGAQLECSKKN